MPKNIFQSLTFADNLVFKRDKKRFLTEVDQLIDWKSFEGLLSELIPYKKSKKGQVPYPNIVMFKALLLQRWYDLSDTALEEALEDRQSFWTFVGLSASSHKPDETTICRFRNAISKSGGYTSLLVSLNQQIQDKGLCIQAGTIVDASLVKSTRRPRKVVQAEQVIEDRKEQELSPSFEVEYSDDQEAKWIKKGNQPLYGFKVHAAVDSEHGMVLGGVVTGANRNDGKLLEEVLERVLPQKGSRVYGDKGYVSRNNKDILKGKNLKNGIMDKATKGKKLSRREVQRNKLISKVRYKVERCFGTLKRDYGMGRSRYLGIVKTENLFYLNAIAMNIKKAVNLAY